MADIVERLIELISSTEPLEDKFSGVVAGFIERTAVKLSRLEGDAGRTVDQGRDEGCPQQA